MTKGQSKYEKYFKINYKTHKSECKRCGKIMTQNAFGMKSHLKTCYNITNFDNDKEVRNPTPSTSGTGSTSSPPGKKLKTKPASEYFEKVIEPIEDQINREVSQYGASFW